MPLAEVLPIYKIFEFQTAMDVLIKIEEIKTQLRWSTLLTLNLKKYFENHILNVNFGELILCCGYAEFL